VATLAKGAKAESRPVSAEEQDARITSRGAGLPAKKLAKVEAGR
jgi:hypothetical protein